MNYKLLRLVVGSILLVLIGYGLYLVAAVNHGNEIAIRTTGDKAMTAINAVLIATRECKAVQVKANHSELCLINSNNQPVVHYYCKDRKLYQDNNVMLTNVKDIYYQPNNGTVEITLVVGTGMGLPDTVLCAVARPND